MITSSKVTTQYGIAYMRRPCKHFAHKIPASVEGNRGSIEFPFGVCTISCDENHMFIRVELDTADEVARAERVIEDHLTRMANKDEPVVRWERGLTSCLPIRPGNWSVAPGSSGYRYVSERLPTESDSH